MYKILRIPQLFVAIAGGSILFAANGMAASYGFQTLNNSNDSAFNQLLGINNAGTIAGYYGDGVAITNHGYTLAPPYNLPGNGSYTNENFTGAFQTQVVGINSTATPVTVGFWADPNGNNFGWVKQGATFTQVVNPSTPAAAPGTTTINQLLGVNNNNITAGFYTDAAGNDHGYLYNIATAQFTSIGPAGATSTMATGINNSGIVSGVVTDGTGTHGFIDNNGTYTTYNDPFGASTMFFGLNNNNQVVGTYVDGTGLAHGLVYNLLSNTWQTVDDPFASTTTVFTNVNGTTLNGINDLGQLVGFYSDGTNVDGVLATPVPEPGPLGLTALAIIAIAFGFRRKRTKP